ncbi:hypothetical protein, partial [Stenotrophomonas maltophilia]|uniref:hypothetical protein n=2 Tax=Bacteria TaxID=2 RepID=UPI00301B5CF4
MTTTLSPERLALPELGDWCAQVRTLHDENARPITSPEDPRAVTMQTGYRDAEETVRYATYRALRDIESEPDRAGETFFEHWVELPAPPFQGPAWAESHSYTMAWPQVTVDFESAPIEVGDATAYLTQSWTIQVADKEYAHGPELACSVWDSTPCVQVVTDEEST